jgi:hypothetical protein
MLSKMFQCSDCSSQDGYRSRPRTFTERYILPLMLLRPVRCSVCFRRTYESVFVQVRERNEPKVSSRAAA